MNIDWTNVFLAAIPFLQSVAYLAAICGFVWYMRKDSKDDYSNVRKESKEDYLRMEIKLEAWRNETNGILKAIQEEMKEFHGRMCSIEERSRLKQ